MKISNKTILKALFTEVKVSKMLYACTILLFMESCFDIVGRKTLSQSPSPSIESSKKIGAYIGSYHWRFISYVDCCVDTLVSIKESFIEKSHHWYSYESDSTVCIDNEYFHIVKLSKKHKNIIFTDFIYGNRMRSRTLVCEYRNTPINTIKDTISTYVIWVPDNHFDEYGVYKFSLNEVPCAKKFNCATTKGNIKLEKGAIVLGKLQFVRDKNDLADEVATKDAAIEALEKKGLKMQDMPTADGAISAEFGRLYDKYNGNIPERQLRKWGRFKNSKGESYRQLFREYGGHNSMRRLTHAK